MCNGCTRPSGTPRLYTHVHTPVYPHAYAHARAHAYVHVYANVYTHVYAHCASVCVLAEPLHSTHMSMHMSVMSVRKSMQAAPARVVVGSSQSLHLLLMRPCGHIPEASHSLQWYLAHSTQHCGALHNPLRCTAHRRTALRYPFTSIYSTLLRLLAPAV